jgi:hypothetical protein
MNFLRKIQQLPEKQRKIIFWVVIVALSASLIFVWVKIAQKRMVALEGRSPAESLGLPEWEFPDLNITGLGEELDKLKQAIIEESENNVQETATTAE